VRIEPFDVVNGDEAARRAHYEIFATVEAEAIPHPEPQYPPYPEWKAWMCIEPPSRRSMAWHAWDGDELVGFSYFMYFVEEANQNLGTFWVYVRPDARRRGVGRSLFEPVVAAALANGRTLIDAAGHPRIPGSIEFLQAVGGRHAFFGRFNVAQVDDIDLDLLNRWGEQAKERAADYDMEVLDSPVADRRVEAMVAAQDIMNTAPREEMQADDDVFTVELWREAEATLAARQADHWILAAVHRPTGAIAGYTEVTLPSLWPARAYQGDTGVHPDHRERGLGRWLKAAMALRLINERPAVRSISTGNAGSNAPMLNINHQMGFRCAEERDFHQVPLG
jgi:GNAT superfamily N-acetyltransferase